MQKIGFIGAGNMAGAILNGVISTHTYPAESLFVYDLSQEKMDAFAARGIGVFASAAELTNACDIIFLAVKPQNFAEVLEGIAPSVTENKLFVTIAAGISSSYIQTAVGCACPVIRVMPNTPLLLGKGATAMCRTEQVNAEQFQLIQGFFASCGTVSVLEEAQMNAVISVNGSSPAYFYLFAKAMIDSAKQQGIDGETALTLVCQTLIGSAAMLRDSNMTPEELICMVSSPGGTTLKALDVFYAHHLEATVAEAMQACTDRAEELGK